MHGKRETEIGTKERTMGEKNTGSVTRGHRQCKTESRKKKKRGKRVKCISIN